MFKQANPFFLIVETPLHAGSGSDLGIVDLPIQREKHTDYPKIEASGLKGSIREIFEAQASKDEIELVFGPEKGDLHAGALGFTDARLLLFPVKSVKGVFAWVTCPAVLERFKHDLSICQQGINFVDIPDANTVPNNSDLIVKEGKIVLEEYTFSVTSDPKFEEVAKRIADNVLPANVPSYGYWKEKMKKDIVVLSDDDFRDFVMLSTEVIARTRIDNEKGTVVGGALWYEEYLPTDSILYSLALTTPLFIKPEGNTDNEKEADEKKKKGQFYVGKVANKNQLEAEKVMNFFTCGLPDIIQIGGNATVGKGIVRTHVYQNQGGNDGTGSDNTQTD
ncbi:MAG: type III-B CRISPR module RAMP protein Cmr4 [Candidatus Poribacteria bacterium]|nr:type III-B CRISPR module RAMP protein Cmr4 [Candidatus Poribacteria bacterium]